MSQQTAAIRARLNELHRDANALKIRRNDAVMDIARNPRDADAGKRLASLSSTIPTIEEQITAFEQALDHAIARDRVDKSAEAASNRRSAVESAIKHREAIPAHDAEIAKVSAQLAAAEARRDATLRACVSAARSLVTLRNRDGNLNAYGDAIRAVTAHAWSDDAVRLREYLEAICDQADARDGITEGLV